MVIDSQKNELGQFGVHKFQEDARSSKKKADTRRALSLSAYFASFSAENIPLKAVLVLLGNEPCKL